MRLVGLFLFAIICLEVVVAAKKQPGLKKCRRQLGKVPPGRKCRKPCKSDRDCKGKKRCHCDNVCGKSCFNKEASCSDPGNLENGKIAGDSFVYDAVIEYVCHRGYVLHGPSKRVCQADRKWSGTVPTCTGGCPAPPRWGISFVSVEENIFKIGSNVTYKCRFGYHLNGDATSECLRNQSWSIPKHLCIPVNCGDPGKPINGYVEGNDFTFGKWITYRCDKGYIIDDEISIKRYCSTAGRWSGTPRSCSKLRCGQPKDPENGYIVGREGISTEFQSTVRYRCDQGYRIVGLSTGQCNEDGNWGQLPNCIVDVNCNFDSSSYSMCGYTNIGAAKWSRYLMRHNTISGSPSYILRATGESAVLLSPAVLSQESHCFKFHYFIKKIRDDRSITVTTNQGVEILGRVRPAEERSRWLSQQLTVYPIPKFGSIQYEVRQNDKRTEVDLDDFSLETGQCDTNCHEETCVNGGICIDRIGNYSCLCNRFFTGRNCEIEVLCPPLQDVAHAKVQINPRGSFKPGTMVTFSCLEGFKRTKGFRQIRCTDDGTWSHSRLPVCEEIVCHPVRRPGNGGRILSTKERGKITIGSTVTFTCPINMYLKGGPEIMVCNKDGSWSSALRPSCKRKEVEESLSSCPSKYSLFNTTCYRVYHTALNFHEATSRCAVNDANLAIIRSREERRKIRKLMPNRKWYYYGATNAGHTEMRWSNNDRFVKVSSETYLDIYRRKDITTIARCGVMYKYRGALYFTNRRCNWKREFICQTFASNVLAVELYVRPNLQLDIEGVYRPMVGVTYNGSPVYKRQNESRHHLYRTTAGWEVGLFNIQNTIPDEEASVIKVNTAAMLPQDITESWSVGAIKMNYVIGDKDIHIIIYDLWEYWSNWSDCSKTCGPGGTRMRTRRCLQEGGARGFGDCKGKHLDKETCNTKECIITNWGSWSQWGNCSKPCGGGKKTKSRICVRDPESQEFCKGNHMMEEFCSTQECGSETSTWRKPAHLKNEYRILSLTNQTKNASIICSKKGGKLANVTSQTEIDYLSNFLDDVHCQSESAFDDWILQLNNEFQAKLEYNEEVAGGGDKRENISVDVSILSEKCLYVSHSCDRKQFSFSKMDCIGELPIRFVCEREWQPCKNKPCGEAGRCEIVNQTHYVCNCEENFYGANCQFERKGCNLSLQRIPNGSTPLNNSYHEITADKFIDEGEYVFIYCTQESIIREFTCTGRNQWSPNSMHNFCKRA